ncbi:MAG: response regulator [Candidatus Neomarinimicrobiota bacterium]
MAASILVVDDEKYIVEAVTQHLQASGYEVEGLMDSAKALETVQNEDFDLVLLDLRMPEVSGMEIARAVHAKSTDTKLIILTGYATLDSAIESVSLDVYAYLNKPFELRELGRIVDRALTAQRVQRENEALQVRISKMLKDVSTLYEVTRFLYDTDDCEITMEFVLDTLSIGLGITHSCLILKDEDQGCLVGKTNFPAGSTLAERVTACSWNFLDTAVSPDEQTLLDFEGKPSEFPIELSTPDEPLAGIVFTPIRYRELLLGFLVVFLPVNMPEFSEDQRMLLRILALQVAPQVYQCRVMQSTAGIDAPWHSEAQRIFSRQVNAHEASDECIGVNLLRFITPRTLASQKEMKSFHQRCSDLLRKHEPKADIHWLVADTALAFFPGANQVQSEITCMAFAEDFRKSELAELQAEGVAELFYASASWPQNAPNPAEFLNKVWARLLHQIHQHVHQQYTVKPRDE